MELYPVKRLRSELDRLHFAGLRGRANEACSDKHYSQTANRSGAIASQRNKISRVVSLKKLVWLNYSHLLKLIVNGLFQGGEFCTESEADELMSKTHTPEPVLQNS